MKSRYESLVNATEALKSDEKELQLHQERFEMASSEKFEQYKSHI